jgi:hypothetical protein
LNDSPALIVVADEIPTVGCGAVVGWVTVGAGMAVERVGAPATLPCTESVDVAAPQPLSVMPTVKVTSIKYIRKRRIMLVLTFHFINHVTLVLQRLFHTNTQPVGF